MTEIAVTIGENPISAAPCEWPDAPDAPPAPHADLGVLCRVARRTVNRAFSRLTARAFDATDAVYVVMDARRSPGRELAIEVIAEDERIAHVEARKLVDARIENTGSVGIPFVLAVVVSRETLRSSAAGRALPAAEVEHWLTRRLPKSACRVLLLGGMYARLDFMQVESDGEQPQA